MQPAPPHPDSSSPVGLAAQSALGRAWLAIFSCVALYPAFGYRAVGIAAVIGLASFLPAWRRSLLSALAVAMCLNNLVPRFVAGSAGRITMSYAVLEMAAVWIALLLAWTRWLPPRAVSRHSLLLLHVMAAGLITGLWMMRGRGALAGVIAGGLSSLVPELLWRSSYWIKWRTRQPEKAPIWSNLFAALPFLGAGGVPIGKGPEYLASHEARDPGQLASAQLEGARLLLLAILWRVTDAFLAGLLWARASAWVPEWAVSRHPLLPAMETLLHLPFLYPWWERWAALYGELFHVILTLAVFSHTLVGIFCLAGFHIPRNMQSPLTATTILDFWGRYYFYFKELLMDFWFFPVFLRASRLPVLWRTMLATVAAAFVGNFYYHVILYWPRLAAGDAENFRAMLLARAIYCALLATGLCGSFARSLARRGKPSQARLPRRVFQALVVSAFFAVLHVWNFIDVPISWNERITLWKTLLP
jgi:hypothetical protein